MLVLFMVVLLLLAWYDSRITKYWPIQTVPGFGWDTRTRRHRVYIANMYFGRFIEFEYDHGYLWLRIFRLCINIHRLPKSEPLDFK